MCGPYIHGRSWKEQRAEPGGITKEDWFHFCQPFEVNSHHDMPSTKDEEWKAPERKPRPARVPISPSAAGPMQINSRAAGKSAAMQRQRVMAQAQQGIRQQQVAIQNQRVAGGLLGSGAALAGAGVIPGPVKRRAFPDLYTPFFDSMVLAQFKATQLTGRALFGIDFAKDEEEELLKVDWGIKPWNGKVAKQRGDITDALRESIVSASFMPATQQELIKWVETHWGSHSDGDEFTREMVQCLDVSRIVGRLPKELRKRAKSIQHESPECYDIHPAASLSDARAVSLCLENASVPQQRFVDMFKEAPNEYWAAKN